MDSQSRTNLNSHMTGIPGTAGPKDALSKSSNANQLANLQLQYAVRSRDGLVIPRPIEEAASR
jgi:hypothetical protein